ncbi:MAG: hypothetical protein M1823_002603 [Watsoniomyces obsoletus]|nr:MAG: hypothetical protein M1823_002603 [Watsoniomyces obsoletus]
MAAVSRDVPLNPNLSLSPEQQELLVAALASNKPRGATDVSKGSKMATTSSNKIKSEPMSSGRATNQAKQSTTELEPSSTDLSLLDDFRLADGSLIDYNLDLGWDDPLNVEDGLGMDGDETGELLDEVPSTRTNGDGPHEAHEKRKNPGDDDDGEGGGKRREGDEKPAKKPGRKPLTSEPTTKRKAQNRAAQRAFRERKEKHLKDLETKVADLERASESANHENGLLRAQVTRLQDELKEYRRRLSTGARLGSLPSDIARDSTRKTSGGGGGFGVGNNFQFEFPKFGSLPGSFILENGSFPKLEDPSKVSPSPLVDGMTTTRTTQTTKVPGVLQRNHSSQQTISPRSETGTTSQAGKGFFGGATSANGQSSNHSNPFSPSLLGNGNSSALSPQDYFPSPSLSIDLSAGDVRKESRGSMGQTSFTAPPMHGLPPSASASPTASSVSLHGANSSPCTSPDSYRNSPSNNKGLDTPINSIGETLAPQGWEAASTNTFPLVNDNSTTSTVTGSNGIVNGIDWMAQQNGGRFDPVLFGDYREPQEAITSGDYGFFGDTFPMYNFNTLIGGGDDYTPNSTGTGTGKNMTGLLPTTTTTEKQPAMVISDPSPTDIVPPPPTTSTSTSFPPGSRLTPAEEAKFAVDCTKLWNRIAQNERFQNGDVDIDSLCTDLQKKARCSETGVAIDPKMIDALLAKFPGQK